MPKFKKYNSPKDGQNIKIYRDTIATWTAIFLSFYSVLTRPHYEEAGGNSEQDKIS